MTKKPQDEPVFLIDTREQLPYPLWPAKSFKLDEGDYSVEGLQGRVAIERKTLSDFIGSITPARKNEPESKDRRKRFFRELRRFENYDFAAIVVEGNLSDILFHRYRSLMPPSSVLGTIVRILLMGIPVIMAGDRQGGKEITERILTKAWRDAIQNGVIPKVIPKEEK